MEKIGPFFIWGGKSSSDYHITLQTADLFTGAERDIDKIEVPGRDGDLIVDNGRYKNVKLALPCTFASRFQGDALYARKIKGWLLSHPGEYLRMETSEDPDYFRMAAFSGPLEIESIAEGFGDFEIEFDCKPYLYSKAGQLAQDVTPQRKLFNPEAFDALPYIKIMAEGNVRFTIGNTAWDFAGVEQYIEIDSEIMNTFRGTLPQNGKKSGAGYPALKPGWNNFAWTGSVSKVEVIPRWRTL